MSNSIATVVELFLYPVKSMAGVAVEHAHVGLDGLLGDRNYSFVRADQAAGNSFPWMTARQSARMLLYKPEFAALPTPDQAEPPVRVRTPEGQLYEAGDSALGEELVAKMGHPLFLLKSARGVFDCQHLSLFSLATLSALAAEAGCSIDRRQFRANIYMEPASGKPFEEETWTRCLLQIGDVVIGVTKRDGRCMIVNLDPDTATQNPKVLKTVVQGHQGQVGIYANVVRPGMIREGDPIQIVSKL